MVAFDDDFVNHPSLLRHQQNAHGTTTVRCVRGCHRWFFFFLIHIEYAKPTRTCAKDYCSTSFKRNEFCTHSVRDASTCFTRRANDSHSTNRIRRIRHDQIFYAGRILNRTNTCRSQTLKIIYYKCMNS